MYSVYCTLCTIHCTEYKGNSIHGRSVRNGECIDDYFPLPFLRSTDHHHHLDVLTIEWSSLIYWTLKYTTITWSLLRIKSERLLKITVLSIAVIITHNNYT